MSLLWSDEVGLKTGYRHLAPTEPDRTPEHDSRKTTYKPARSTKYQVQSSNSWCYNPASAFHVVPFPFDLRSDMKKTTTLFAAALFVFSAISAFGREARLVRYPHYHNGRIVFTYLGHLDRRRKRPERATADRESRARCLWPILAGWEMDCILE